MASIFEEREEQRGPRNSRSRAREEEEESEESSASRHQDKRQRTDTNASDQQRRAGMPPPPPDPNTGQRSSFRPAQNQQQEQRRREEQRQRQQQQQRQRASRDDEAEEDDDPTVEEIHPDDPRYQEDEDARQRNANNEAPHAHGQANAQFIPGVGEVYIPTEHPSEKEQREQLERQNLRAGISQTSYRCVVCALGQHYKTADTTESEENSNLDRVFAMFRTYQPNLEQWSADIAKTFNDTVYTPNQRLRPEVRNPHIKQWDVAKVRYHIEELRRVNPQWQFYSESQDLKTLQSQLRARMWNDLYIDGRFVRTEINLAVFKAVLMIKNVNMKYLSELVKSEQRPNRESTNPFMMRRFSGGPSQQSNTTRSLGMGMNYYAQKGKQKFGLQ